MCRLLYVAIDRVMGYTYAIFGTYKKLNMIEIDKSIVQHGHDLQGRRKVWKSGGARSTGWE